MSNIVQFRGGEMDLTHFSLFTGIAGLDKAAEWAGFRTIGQCEWADYPIKVLEKHWPNAERWRDVREVTIQSIRERGIQRITLLSGGFPCQPHSTAGERKASDDERDLWPEYKRIICETRPKWIVGENVPGILSSENGRFFGGILRDLAGMGYNAAWFSPKAEWIGADFEGKRVFIVATPDGSRWPEVVCSYIRSYAEKSIKEKAVAINSCSDTILRLEKRLGKPGVLGDGDGVPNRMDRLKCLGNSVRPQQVYPILKAIYDIETGVSR